jgi:type II secretory pathway component GspD/PulD (secretin)
VNQPFRQVQQQPQQVDANGNPIGTSGQTDAQLQGLGAEKLAELSRLKAQRHANGKTGAGVTAEDVGAVSPSAEPLIYVSVNSPQNSLVIRTSDSRALDEIATLIAQLDRPVPQVLLEMKILELDLQDDFSSVFDFDYVEPVAQNPGNSIGGKQNPFLATGATAPTNVVGAGNFNLNPASTLVYQFLNERIRARVQLLERERRVNVLSTPLLLCVNHGSARLFIGEERILTRSFQATGSVIAQNTVTQPVVVPITQLRNIGKSLSIVPQINADRTVTLTVVQENSAVNPGAAVIPVPLGNGGTGQFAVDTVDTSNLAGTVVAKDGMTVAIGGLIEDRIDRREDKVPFLGDIPLLGVFFKSTDRGRRRTELMLLITPRVLLTPAEGQTVTRERLLALSIHPYQDLGDRAAQAYEKHEVPQASREHVFMRDLLAPDPEPAK